MDVPQIFKYVRLLSILLCSLGEVSWAQTINSEETSDTSFIQEFSIKYYASGLGRLKKVFADRNGNIQVLADSGLFQPSRGKFLYPGELVANRKYRPMKDMDIRDMALVEGQFLYLTDKFILGNAWAGTHLLELDEEGMQWPEEENDRVEARKRGQLESLKVPVDPINCIKWIQGNYWYGTDKGAFMERVDGGFNYYQGERWLPGDTVIHIAQGPDSSILILTQKGLAQLIFQPWTLQKKAAYYEKQVRSRHIRYGLNASLGEMQRGRLETGVLKDSDNDGLWTAMYLASQAFRYAVEGTEEALQNCRESLDAMERLFSVNPVKGFPSRSFERRGYIPHLADVERWQPALDPNWDWKATTSSDEAIGHMFAYGVIAEIVDDTALQAQSIRLMDNLMTHIVENNWYLVDYDGKPTTWGRWHPDYVNARLKMVGDRKLNSSNIISMLQTAYHFTGKSLFKEKAYELMEEYGYLENLLRPMSEIGPAPDTADDWDRMLSESWNHSDDEMYFLGYWGLYRYAFTDSLKKLYKEAILDHWEAERPEKEGAWNIFTAMTGVDTFDREAAIWYLQAYPLDLIDWDIKNSHRKDLEYLEENFRGQKTKEVLPPDERPIRRHNANTFILDRIGGRGRTEYSAGDIWLLPYWMGRFLGVIQAGE